jgi:hypothetical protein
MPTNMRPFSEEGVAPPGLVRIRARTVSGPHNCSGYTAKESRRRSR